MDETEDCDDNNLRENRKGVAFSGLAMEGLFGKVTVKLRCEDEKLSVTQQTELREQSSGHRE